MRNRLDEQLELLNTELIRMGALCEDGISQAAKGVRLKQSACACFYSSSLLRKTCVSSLPR